MEQDIDWQPTLTGERVIVRPLQSGDWAGLYAAASDPLIWAQHPASDRHEEAVFRQYFDEAIDSGSAFAFINRDSGEIIGSSRYHGHDPIEREVEIGWTFLTRAYWGGEVNADIKRLMIDYALKYVDTVVFWVGESNLRSRRAMEKIGGILRPGKYFKDDDNTSPNVVYEIRKADWCQAHP